MQKLLPGKLRCQDCQTGMRDVEYATVEWEFQERPDLVQRSWLWLCQNCAKRMCEALKDDPQSRIYVHGG